MRTLDQDRRTRDTQNIRTRGLIPQDLRPKSKGPKTWDLRPKRRRTCNHVHKILRNFPFTTGEAKRDY